MLDINQELLNAIKKSFYDVKERKVNPRLIHEQDLLILISKITNNETAHKARELFHSSKNVYDFDDYLVWLSKLVDLLLDGTPPDKAFNTVRCSIIKKYREPLAIFNY